MPVAHARHILVDTEEQANDLKGQIEGGADFGEMAREHSSCPSKAQGGDLGQFGPGQMVEEFDAVIWSEDVGAVHGPVETAFGYHLIEILSRTD
jgi:peptidyl-prolyl cis-trans isomerase C